MKAKVPYAEPEHVRRKLAAMYRKQAADSKRKKADRVILARMADDWERTLLKSDNI